LRCRYGVSLIWAAKPSVRESPNPAKSLAKVTSASALLLILLLRSVPAESSLGRVNRCHCIGRFRLPRGSKKCSGIAATTACGVVRMYCVCACGGFVCRGPVWRGHFCPRF